MPYLELEIPCSGLSFDHVIDPSGPSGAAPKGAPCTCGEMIRSQNFFKKTVDTNMNEVLFYSQLSDLQFNVPP